MPVDSIRRKRMDERTSQVLDIRVGPIQPTQYRRHGPKPKPWRYYPHLGMIGSFLWYVIKSMTLRGN